MGSLWSYPDPGAAAGSETDQFAALWREHNTLGTWL